jgi:hypothetical protein
MSSLVGLWYRYNIVSGRFIPLGDPVAAANSPSDGCVCVTSVTDPEPMVCQALNAAYLLPPPAPNTLSRGRWTVVWATLKAAWQGSTTTPLVVTTA